jgi:hypothetical protein
MPGCQSCAPADGVLIVCHTDRNKQATWRPQRQHKYSNTRTLTISTPSAEAHGWHPGIEKKWHNRAPASVRYTITLEDGRVRPKHVDE